MTTLSPTGIQVQLQRGEVAATVTEVGASLRALSVGGTALIPPFPENEPAPGCAGVVLVPWPNRIRDGRWNDDGTERELAITEPKLDNAIHGLLRYSPYAIDAHEDTVTLRATIHPQLGYPYEIATSVTYALTDDGIHVTHTLENRSDAPAPVALGTHPYFMIEGVDTGDLVLRIPAATQIDTDDRLLPTGTSPIPAPLREGVALRDVDLDTAFADLDRDDDGRIRHTLTAPDGRRVALWQGAGFEFSQVYTGTGYPGQALVVAIEPMTAPAEAFNTGVGLRRLAPGESWTLEWGITFSRS